MDLINAACAGHVSTTTDPESHTDADQSDSNFIAMLEHEAGEPNLVIIIAIDADSIYIC
jgi:hypothetical protein